MLRAAPPVYTGRVLEEVGEVKEEVDHTPVELATPLELDAVVVAVVQVHVAEVVLYPVALPETLEEVVVGHELLLPEWPQYVQSQLLYSEPELEALAAAQPETMQVPTTSTKGVAQRAPSLVTLYLAKQFDQQEGMEKAAAWPARATAATMRLLVYILNDYGT